ncbi:hypothetical protein EGW08_019833, partial [Elysia chlorotica]
GHGRLQLRDVPLAALVEQLAGRVQVLLLVVLMLMMMMLVLVLLILRRVVGVDDAVLVVHAVDELAACGAGHHGRVAGRARVRRLRHEQRRRRRVFVVALQGGRVHEGLLGVKLLLQAALLMLLLLLLCCDAAAAAGDGGGGLVRSRRAAGNAGTLAVVEMEGIRAGTGAVGDAGGCGEVEESRFALAVARSRVSQPGKTLRGSCWLCCGREWSPDGRSPGSASSRLLLGLGTGTALVVVVVAEAEAPVAGCGG